MDDSWGSHWWHRLLLGTIWPFILGCSGRHPQDRWSQSFVPYLWPGSMASGASSEHPRDHRVAHLSTSCLLAFLLLLLLYLLDGWPASVGRHVSVRMLRLRALAQSCQGQTTHLHVSPIGTMSHGAVSCGAIAARMCSFGIVWGGTLWVPCFISMSCLVSTTSSSGSPASKVTASQIVMGLAQSLCPC